MGHREDTFHSKIKFRYFSWNILLPVCYGFLRLQRNFLHVLYLAFYSILHCAINKKVHKLKEQMLVVTCRA